MTKQKQMTEQELNQVAGGFGRWRSATRMRRIVISKQGEKLGKRLKWEREVFEMEKNFFRHREDVW